MTNESQIPKEFWIYPRPSSTARFSVSLSRHGYDSFRVCRLEPGERIFTRDEIKQFMLDDFDNETANRRLSELFGKAKP